MNNNNNNNNYNNNNNNNFVNNNCNSNTNITSAKEFFKRLGCLIKNYYKNHKSFLSKKWNNLTLFQKLIFIALFFVLPLMLIIYTLIANSNIKINRNLNADYSTLSLNNNVPFTAIINNNDSTFKSALPNILNNYYSDFILNNDLNYKINYNKLINQVDGTYTYSIWLYINGDNSSVYNFYKHILTNKMLTNSSLNEYNWSNFRYNKFKNIFVRGDNPNDVENLNKIKQYPGMWLGPELTNLYLVFSNGTNSESFLLENLELDKWMNITITINGNTLSIYRNGFLEMTGLVSSLLYLNNIKNKSVYFLGNPNLSSTSQEGFPGFINYFNFYNRVLTPDEINTLYVNYLPLISTYMSNSNSYNLQLAPSVSVINDDTSYSESINIY